jgi:hydroxymethylbilane synthase
MVDQLCLRAGTRSSRLAVWQTELVATRLSHTSPGLSVEHVLITTLGDRISDVPLPRLGGKGVFTRELEDALRAGAIDFAVHSLKDLPTALPDDLAIGAILEREDPRDALVAASPVTIDTLPAGARVGTSSVRRRAQLLARRPDLDVRDLRGNVPTRVDKVLAGDLDAAILAVAGLTRLGLTAHIAEVLSTDVMLPAPGQAALAVEVRADDQRTCPLIALLDDGDTRLATTAERSLLAELEGGCQAPVGAVATFTSTGVMRLEGLVIGLDGHDGIRRAVEAPVSDHAAASALGKAVAARLLAEGASAILAGARQALAALEADAPES